jgi:concanavalin A-like lectin/glucanase superfamily protein
MVRVSSYACVMSLVVGCVLLLSATAAVADLADGLMAWWPLDGDALDASGNGHNGTVVGATPTDGCRGEAGTAFHLDGQNDYIGIGNGVKPPLPITVSFWFRDGDLGGAGTFFRNDKVDDASYRYGFQVQHYGEGADAVALDMYEGFSTASNRRTYRFSGSPTFTDTAWHHLCVVMHSVSSVGLYLDNSYYSGYLASGSGSGITYSSASGAIGQSSDDVVQYCCGDFDEVRVYNRALAADEVHWLFAEPLPGDANNDGAVTDADYTIWADNYGQTGPGLWEMGDFDASGEVTDADYTIWADNYGSGVGSVPEPGCACLLVVSALGMMARRRRD